MKSVPVLPLLCVGGLLLAGTAQADQSVSYDYVELSYVRSNVDLGPLGDIDGNGGRFAFSAEFIENFYVVGSYEMSELDDLPVPDPDVDAWNIGFGWHSDLTRGNQNTFESARDRWSIFAQAAYESFEVSGSSIDGYSAEVGVRGVNHTNFEFIGALGYQEMEDADGEFIAEARLAYNITDDIQAHIGFDYVEDYVRGLIGVRYNLPGFIQ